MDISTFHAICSRGPRLHFPMFGAKLGNLGETRIIDICGVPILRVGNRVFAGLVLVEIGETQSLESCRLISKAIVRSGQASSFQSLTAVLPDARSSTATHTPV